MAKTFWDFWKSFKINVFGFFSLYELSQIENWLMEVITVSFQHIVQGFYISGNGFGFKKPTLFN